MIKFKKNGRVKNSESRMKKIFTSLLKYNCFTMLC